MRRVRVGFLYVTLRLNAATFSKSVRFLFSLVLFFVLIYLYSLHLSSRPRTFLIGAPAQESISKVRFCASFALGRPREKKKSLVLIVLNHNAQNHLKIPFLRFSLFSSVSRVPSAERTWNQSAGPFQRLATSPKGSASVSFRIWRTRARGTGGEIRAGRSILRYISRSLFYVLCGVFSSSSLRVSAQQESLFCAGKIQISSSERELFVVFYNEREHA